jgi:hypothetical protein
MLSARARKASERASIDGACSGRCLRRLLFRLFHELLCRMGAPQQSRSIRRLVQAELVPSATEALLRRRLLLCPPQEAYRWTWFRCVKKPRRQKYRARPRQFQNHR